MVKMVLGLFLPRHKFVKKVETLCVFVPLYALTFLVVFLILSQTSNAQWVNNLRTKYIPIKTDTVAFDTLSIIPQSLYLITNGKDIDTSAYGISFENASLIWKKNSMAYKAIKEDSIKLVYRVFPYLMTQSYQHKDIHKIQKDIYGNVNPYSYSGTTGAADLFQFQGLNKSGSISRGVTFGNNQDLVVNSNLNLQLAGKLSDNVEILASITDQNVPIQPEGNTKQIQDFDKVFIQISRYKAKLIAGDFEMKKPDSYFMNFYKKAQGGIFTDEFALEDSTNNKHPGMLKVGASAAISKGIFARNTIQGIEGNQGPYKLTGSNNELYIVVLSGSEKVYIDGALMQRGQDNDYIIDYNTAEVTFMPKRLITKDSRLIVEYQYSNNYFTRSILYMNTEYSKDNFKLRFNAYSEQDGKNQPLLQSLDTTEEKFLAGIGNNITQAYYPAVTIGKFDSTRVSYLKQDTTVNGILYKGIYVYSTAHDSPMYQLGFTNVPQDSGDYVLASSIANGSVYQWVAPVNGVKQGNYEPVVLLVTPKKLQLFTLGGDYAFSKNTKMTFETALSNNDVNLFSITGKQDDVGEAFKIGFENVQKLDKDSAGWKLVSGIKFEGTTKDFQAIERYRPTEFERDWNVIPNDTLKASDQLGDLSFSLMNPKSGSINYDFKTYLKGEEYKDIMNTFSTNLTWNKFRLLSNFSLLDASGTVNPSIFIRQKVDLSKAFKYIMFGVEEDEEDNRFKNPLANNILPNSYRYNQWQVYITNPDTTKNKFRLDYGERYDFGPWGLTFKEADKARNADFSYELLKNPNSKFTISTTYRTIDIYDTTLTTQAQTNTLLNRVEYSFNVYKRLITSTTFYEIGTGQQQKQQYTYVQVPAGTGVYTYLGDLNHNGVQDLNEFAVSQFQDQADYIRVYTPTNIFVKDYTNRFNETFSLNPAALLGNKVVGFKKFISRFSDNFTFATDRKTADDDLKSLFNPFANIITDSSLISTNVSERNSIYFNKTNSSWGMDYTISNNRNKTLLADGFDSRIATENAVNMRWNVTRIIGLNLSLKQGDKQSLSDYSKTSDYNFNYKEIDPKISYQPNVSFRTSLTYSYIKKNNDPAYGGETAIENNFGTEIKYSTTSKGILTAKFNYVKFNFNGAEDTQVAFAMLDGLQNGNNFTWGLNLQRTLSGNLQLSLNYDGRKSEGSNVVHTGSVQLRAYF